MNRDQQLATELKGILGHRKYTGTPEVTAAISAIVVWAEAADSPTDREVNADMAADLTVWQSTAESLKAELVAEKAKGEALANEVEEEVEFMKQQRLFGCADRMEAALAAYRAGAVKDDTSPQMFAVDCQACDNHFHGTIDYAISRGWTANTDHPWRCPKCSTPAEATSPPSPATDELTIAQEHGRWKVREGGIVIADFIRESDARRFAASQEMVALLEYIPSVVTLPYSDNVRIKAVLAKARGETK